MVYVQPLPTLSSIVIKGGADSPHSDEYVFRHVDIDLIMNDPDVRSNLLDAITRAFHELGVECLGSGDNKHLLAIEIDDKDIDKFVNLNLEIEANALIDELSGRMYITEFYDFIPSIVRLSGSILIEGFEVVD
jgi:hypothetical protein